MSQGEREMKYTLAFHAEGKKAVVLCQKVTLPVSVGGGATNRGDDAVVSVSGVAVTTAESLSS